MLDPFGQCPAGWREMPGTNKCYLVTKNKAKGFDDARQACRLQQGDLIKINTIAEKVNSCHLFLDISSILRFINFVGKLFTHFGFPDCPCCLECGFYS